MDSKYSLTIWVKTILTYIFWSIIFLFFSSICLPFMLLPEKIRYHNRLYFYLTTLWNKLLVKATFLNIEIFGKENIPNYPNTPSIIISNHSSSLDIFLIESIIKNYPHVWLSKDVYGKIPIFNIFMKKMHVLVKRENPTQALQALLKALQIAKLGPKHIMIFPEGKRYLDGKIHDFFKGFAILTKKLNYPVIPILITETNKIFPKGRLLIDSNNNKVKLIIGKPFVFEKKETEEEFMNKIHNWFTTTLEQKTQK